MIKSNYKVIALMSGTSLDGIDIIYLTLSFNSEWSFRIHHSETKPYSAEWKSKLSNLVERNPNELPQLDIDYSELLGKEILSFISDNRITDIDFVASHGHTALHQPDEGLTYQIGNTQALADTVGCKVICDFRTQDVAFGGQGAPLVPIGDRLLFGDYDYCLNLGGFANVSYEEQHTRLAFDICPVNILLNHYAAYLGKAYDDKGVFASRGKLVPELLERLNALSYYELNPPKSLGLEWVQAHVFPLIDLGRYAVNAILRTLTEHIAFQITCVINGANSRVLVTGGGAYNAFLIQRLSALSEAEFIIPESQLVEYKEALIFGLLGVLRERNQVNCLRSVTGANKDHCSGKILWPES
jgi:anhydro-N-acetylmuramic acid kinase